MPRKQGLGVDDLPRGKVLRTTWLLACPQQPQGGYGFVLDRKRLKVFDPPISIPPGGFRLGLWKWKA
jgi:hypothetical protein